MRQTCLRHHHKGTAPWGRHVPGIITKEQLSEADIHRFLSVPGIATNEQFPGELRNLTLALILDMFPHNAWIYVYTDVSAEKTIMKNDGRGVCIRYTRWWQHFPLSSWLPSVLRLSSWNTGHPHSCRAPVGMCKAYGKYCHLHWLPVNPTSPQPSWSRPALLPCQADSSISIVPLLGACSCGTDRK